MKSNSDENAFTITFKFFFSWYRNYKTEADCKPLSYRHSFGLIYGQNWILSRSVKTLTFDINAWSKITAPKKLYVEYSQIELKIYRVYIFF